jgi:hypothetical protein
MHPSTKSKFFSPLRLIAAILAFFLTAGMSPPAAAATFAARISPPNFELKAKPGDVLRRTITISNSDAEPAHYQVRTADWDLNEQGGVIIVPVEKPLPATSCRSWTRIERRSLKLAPNGTKRYRFEVHVPEDAAEGQCRFAMVISPAPETVDTMAFDNFKFPISGAIAVIVYVTVGKARAQLEFKGIHDRQQKAGGHRLVMRFINTGNAHGRPFGSVMAKDASGKKAELIAVPFPILPGRTHDIELMADPEISGIKTVDELAFPLHLKGRIEWDGGACQVDHSLK